jgi:hypothetical protein
VGGLAAVPLNVRIQVRLGASRLRIPSRNTTARFRDERSVESNTGANLEPLSMVSMHASTANPNGQGFPTSAHRTGRAVSPSRSLNLLIQPDKQRWQGHVYWPSKFGSCRKNLLQLLLRATPDVLPPRWWPGQPLQVPGLPELRHGARAIIGAGLRSTTPYSTARMAKVCQA